MFIFVGFPGCNNFLFVLVFFFFFSLRIRFHFPVAIMLLSPRVALPRGFLSALISLLGFCFILFITIPFQLFLTSLLSFFFPVESKLSRVALSCISFCGEFSLLIYSIHVYSPPLSFFPSFTFLFRYSLCWYYR